MNLGEKIIELRKKSGLSQEELAEKVGATRQTISKWELEQTRPDVKQAQELSKIFNVTLDELVNNDVNNVIINRIESTEKKVKKTNILMQVLVVLGILVIIFVAYVVVRINNKEKQREIVGGYKISCELDGQKYEYEIQYNKDFEIIYCGGDSFIDDHIDLIQYNDANQAKAHIEDYFKEHGGFCNIIDNN